MIDKIYLKNFTVFRELDLPVSPGINVVVGDNGTGKTHLLKAAYGVLVAEYRVSKDDKFGGVLHHGHIHEKLEADFLTKNADINSLYRKFVKENNIEDASIRILIGEKDIGITFSKNGGFNTENWKVEKNNENGQPVVFIPEKDMLANAPGLTSLFLEREIHFEEYLIEIIQKANLPKLRKLDDNRKQLLTKIEEILEGIIVIENDTFYLENSYGKFEFTMVATGMRKLGLLWLLIRNGSLGDGATLFWDEPEANLNPSMLEATVEILLELQRHGVQIFLATHNYVLLKLLELKQEKTDQLQFISLSKNSETNDIEMVRGPHYTDIIPNKIADAYDKIYDLELGGMFVGAS
ncbi:MAG: AAA family ATPase [Magnetococcales bacterium]|nr:AAA family ATPase [Magnetococcales bacterium]